MVTFLKAKKKDIKHHKVTHLLYSKPPQQARAEGGAEGAWAPAPLPKVPFCQGNFFFL